MRIFSQPGASSTEKIRKVLEELSLVNNLVYEVIIGARSNDSDEFGAASIREKSQYATTAAKKCYRRQVRRVNNRYRPFGPAGGVLGPLLEKNFDVVSRWMRMGAERKCTYEDFGKAADHLDRRPLELSAQGEST